MRNEVYPKARSENLVVQSLPGETLVYDLTAHKAHCLNETSTFVWDSCTGELSIDQIKKNFEVRFGQPIGDEFVALALAQLHERDLLDVTTRQIWQIHDRRSVIKKIGLASAVAIPVISSLVAPPNALSIAANCVCTNNIACSNLPACPSTRNCNPLGLCAPS